MEHEKQNLIYLNLQRIRSLLKFAGPSTCLIDATQAGGSAAVFAPRRSCRRSSADPRRPAGERRPLPTLRTARSARRIGSARNVSVAQKARQLATARGTCAPGAAWRAAITSCAQPAAYAACTTEVPQRRREVQPLIRKESWAARYKGSRRSSLQGSIHLAQHLPRRRIDYLRKASSLHGAQSLLDNTACTEANKSLTIKKKSAESVLLL